jgi:hypothetical protein
VQLGVSPRYSEETAQSGKYSGGMIWTNQRRLGQTWREARTTTGLDAEEAAIEHLANSYLYFEFGPEHNVGFWRWGGRQGASGPRFFRDLWFDQHAQRIMMKDRALASMRMEHIAPRTSGGSEFADVVLHMLGNSTDSAYGRIARVIRWCRNSYLPPQLVI